VEAAGTARKQKEEVRQPKTVLRIPDLKQSKNAVLNSLASASSQESYGHAIEEFIGWHCSEPRLTFNRTVVLRYRFFLEQKKLAPATNNARLADRCFAVVQIGQTKFRYRTLFTLAPPPCIFTHFQPPPFAAGRKLMPE
jgi:hypothetical protein